MHSKKEISHSQNWYSIKKQKKQLAHFCRSILFSLDSFCLTGDSEDIHRLRVNIKKLNAFMILLPVKNRIKKKLFKPIQKIFKSISHLRTANVNLELMKEFNLVDPIYKMEQEVIIQRVSDSIISKKLNYTFWVKDYQSDIEHYLKKIKFDAIEALLVKRLNKLKQFYENNPDPNLFHNSRKTIKTLIYLYSVVKDILKDTFYLNLQYLDELQDKIGKWHDIVISMDSLTDRRVTNSTLLKLSKQRAILLKQINIFSADFSKRIYSKGRFQNKFA